MEDRPAAEGIRQFRKPQEVRAGKGEEGRSGRGQGGLESVEFSNITCPL